MTEELKMKNILVCLKIFIGLPFIFEFRVFGPVLRKIFGFSCAFVDNDAVLLSIIFGQEVRL